MAGQRKILIGIGYVRRDRDARARLFHIEHEISEGRVHCVEGIIPVQAVLDLIHVRHPVAVAVQGRIHRRRVEGQARLIRLKIGDPVGASPITDCRLQERLRLAHQL